MEWTTTPASRMERISSSLRTAISLSLERHNNIILLYRGITLSKRISQSPRLTLLTSKCSDRFDTTWAQTSGVNSIDFCESITNILQKCKATISFSNFSGVTEAQNGKPSTSQRYSNACSKDRINQEISCTCCLFSRCQRQRHWNKTGPTSTDVNQILGNQPTR